MCAGFARQQDTEDPERGAHLLIEYIKREKQRVKTHIRLTMDGLSKCCRANWAQIRQSGAESDHGFEVKVLPTF